MLVNLARDWFGPGGVRLRAKENPHSIFGVAEDSLPSGAEVVEEEKPKKASPSPAKSTS